MAPLRPRQGLLTEERVANHFKALKTQSYYDPSSRGPGSHSYVSSKVFGLSPISHQPFAGQVPSHHDLCNAIVAYSFQSAIDRLTLALTVVLATELNSSLHPVVLVIVFSRAHTSLDYELSIGTHLGL
jgi:hypothetical protein